MAEINFNNSFVDRVYEVTVTVKFKSHDGIKTKVSPNLVKSNQSQFEKPGFYTYVMEYLDIDKHMEKDAVVTIDFIECEKRSDDKRLVFDNIFDLISKETIAKRQINHNLDAFTKSAKWIRNIGLVKDHHIIKQSLKQDKELCDCIYFINATIQFSG